MGRVQRYRTFVQSIGIVSVSAEIEQGGKEEAGNNKPLKLKFEENRLDVIQHKDKS